MEELYLNGQRVELGGVKISQTLQINDLAELKDRQLNFTNQFSIPKTPKNIAIMDFLGIVGSTSRVPYIKISAKFVLDGIELIKNGKAVVSGVSEKGYEVAIYSGNIDFYEALEDKKVNELDYNDVNHFLNLTSFQASLSNATGYIYALAQWGYGYVDGQIDIAKMSPVIYLHTLINKIITQAGFTYSGDVFSDTKFLKEVVSPTKGYDVNAAEFTENNLGDVTTNEISKSRVGRSDPENFIDQFTLATTGLTNASLVGNSIHVNFTGQLRVSLSLVSTLDAGTASLQIRKNGTTILYQALPEGSSTTLKDIYVNVTTGDLLTVWLYSYTSPSEDPEPVHDLIVTADCSINLKSVTGGQYVDFSMIMTDKKQLDVMKDFMQCYGLIFKMTGTHLTFIRMEDLYNDRAGAEAWGEKLAGIPSENYEVGAYAKKNIMKYSYEDDAPVTHDGELIVDNENLENEKTLFTSLYRISIPYSSINLKPVYQIPLWEEKDENGVMVVKNKDTSFRKFSILPVTATLTFKFADLVGTTTVTTMPFLSLDNIEYQTYIVDNYPALKRILDRQLKKDVLLNLSIIDIHRVDFFKLKYFPQFGKYYYLNKINNFIKGKATKCELIEV